MSAVDLLDDALDAWTACEAEACRAYNARRWPAWWPLGYVVLVLWCRRPRWLR